MKQYEVLEAIDKLTKTLDEHMKSTNEQLKSHENHINAITSQNSQDSYTGRRRVEYQRQFNGNNRSGNQGRSDDYRQPNNGNNRTNVSANRNRSNVIVCYKCNQPNHYARDCRAPTNPLNSQRRLYTEE